MCVCVSGRLSEDLRLIGALIIARHGHRAPLYSLPNHHPPPLNCHLRHVRSSSVDRAQAARLAAAMDSAAAAADPAWRRHGLYPSSTSCSGAQLTAAGALQMLRLGLVLRRRGYGRLATSGGGVVAVRSSDYSRTVQSAAALLYGLDGRTGRLVQSASVELTRDGYLCLERRRAPSWNVTCGCRAALSTLSLRRRHNRTLDVDERRLRHETANILNTTAARLPWTAAILEVPAVRQRVKYSRLDWHHHP